MSAKSKLAITILGIATIVGARAAAALPDGRSDVQRGHKLFLQGNLEGAVAEYREAIRIKPDDARTHAELGIVLEEKGDLKGAESEYREALRLDPRAARAHDNLASLLYLRGDFDEAITEYREAIRLQPTLEAARYHLREALLHRTDVVADAVPEKHLQLGIDLSGQGDPNDALFEFSKAIRLKPDFAVDNAQVD